MTRRNLKQIVKTVMTMRNSEQTVIKTVTKRLTNRQFRSQRKGTKREKRLKTLKKWKKERRSKMSKVIKTLYRKRVEKKISKSTRSLPQSSQCLSHLNSKQIYFLKLEMWRRVTEITRVKANNEGSAMKQSWWWKKLDLLAKP